MARRRYIQAVNEALMEEMARDDNVILIGEDVELAIFGDTRGCTPGSVRIAFATRRFARRHSRAWRWAPPPPGIASSCT